MLLGDAADGEGIAPVRGKLGQRLDGGLDVAGADGEGEKGHVLVAELGQQTPVDRGQVLTERAVPHVDVAEVVVRRAGIFGLDKGLRPGPVGDGEFAEVQHKNLPFCINRCGRRRRVSPPGAV